MAWVKIDDQFSDHPKVLEVGPLAECLFVRGLTYAARYLTDGFVPDAHLRRMGDLDAFAEAPKLVASGLWHEAEGGFQIHDYLDYQPSSTKVKSEREAARERMEKARAAKQGENASRSSDEVQANSGRSSDNPVPSRPVPSIAHTPSGDLSPKPPSPAKPPAYTVDFESFWQAYPAGHGDKKPSFEAWQKLNPDPEMVQAILDGIHGWQQGQRWREGYIRDAQRWLRDRAWENVPPPFTTTPAATARAPNGRDIGLSTEELIRIGKGER